MDDCQKDCKYNCNDLTGSCERDSSGSFTKLSECNDRCSPWLWECSKVTGDCRQSPDGTFSTQAICEQSCNVRCNRYVGGVDGCTIDQDCNVDNETCFANMASCISTCSPYKWSCSQRTGDCVQTETGIFDTKELCEDTCKFKCEGSTGTCVFFAGGDYDNSVDCNSQCVPEDPCVNSDCGGGVCTADGAGGYTCVCPKCFYNENDSPQGKCIEDKARCCNESAHGTWSGGVCQCDEGWSGPYCENMITDCNVGYYKSRTPANGRPFSCIKCKNCDYPTTKRTDCSGKGYEDTVTCTQKDYWCGTDHCNYTASDSGIDRDKDKDDLPICAINCGPTNGESRGGNPYCGPRSTDGGKSFSGYTHTDYRKYGQAWPFADVYLNHCRFTAPVQYLP